jgi:hypothetical protein
MTLYDTRHYLILLEFFEIVKSVDFTYNDTKFFEGITSICFGVAYTAPLQTS